ncbi:MAG: dienelactone hydrolase family protein [Vicinamibacterales bacterium]
MSGGRRFALLLVTAVALSAAAPGARQTTAAAFGESLALRADRIVADSSHIGFGWLAQTSPAGYVARGALRLTLALIPWDGSVAPVKPLGTFTIYAADLRSSPFPFTIDVRGVPDGYYRYLAEVWDGDVRIASRQAPVVLAAGIATEHAAITGRLAKIAGHDSAKATILYPFDLARVMNLGKRVYGSGNGAPEFGLSQAGVQQLYDFGAGLRRSRDLIGALEKGKDPLWRARGDAVRHYHLAEADEILPYHVFVPATWDGRSALPLVFILHGNSRDQDFYFDRDGRIIPTTATAHGFMLVAPLGYWPNGGYNYVPFSRERGDRGAAAAAAAAQSFGSDSVAPGQSRGGAGVPGGVNGSTIPAMVRSEWSEQDAMHVLELVKQEYPIDPKRTFLFGYSAGGQGAHYFGQKYPGQWAAIAIGGSNATAGDFYRFDRLKNTPMMLVSGSADPVVAATRAMAEALRTHGVDVRFTEYPGQNHDTTPGAATPDIFAFFAAHARR